MSKHYIEELKRSSADSENLISVMYKVFHFYDCEIVKKKKKTSNQILPYVVYCFIQFMQIFMYVFLRINNTIKMRKQINIISTNA